MSDGGRGVGPKPNTQTSDDSQADVDIAPRGVGIRADVVGFLDESLRLCLFHARKRDAQSDIQSEAAFRTRTDADIRGDRGVGRNLDLLLRTGCLQGTDEAGSIAGREKLLGVIAFAAGSTEFLRGRELDVERAVSGGSAAITAAGRS